MGVKIPRALTPNLVRGQVDPSPVNVVRSNKLHFVRGTNSNVTLQITKLGPTGPQGIQGIQGVQGVPGDQMTPVVTTGVTGTVTLTAAMLTTTRTMTLSGNTTIAALPTPSSSISGTITLIIKQAASGGPYTITWPAALEWPNDASGPGLATAANAELIVHLFWTGSAWRGMVAGSFFP